MFSFCCALINVIVRIAVQWKDISYRKTISRFNDKSIITEEKSRKYTRKNDCNINRCFSIIEHRILYKQTTNKNFFMFKFVLYSTRIIFLRDSKFIFSLEEWISRDLMNIVINDFLNRWSLRNFIERHKNEVTSNDCLKHSHRIKIRECHFAKQSFARIFDRYHSTRALESSKRDVWLLDKWRNWRFVKQSS